MAKKCRLLVSLSAVGFLFLWGCSATGTGGARSTPLGDFASTAGTDVGAAGVAGSIDDFSQSGGSNAVTGGTGTDIGGLDWLNEDECAGKMVTITRKPINVIMVVDRSTTMVMSGFGTFPSRWDALRQALMGDPDGLVRQYEGIVRFGYEGFTGYPPTELTGMPCPDLKSVPFAEMNYEPIKPVYEESRPAVFGTGAVGQTPTGESLKIIIDNLEGLLATTTLDVLDDTGPFVILLATDGEPDTCANPNVDGSPEATQIVEQQVARAFGLGINTYVLSVGADTSDAHLQAVANAGTGTNNAPFWKADNDQGLKDALSDIIGAALSCVLELDGEIADVSMACQEGTVIINGEPIMCDDSGNGWQVVDSTHIELVGDACKKVKSSPSVMLEARFPCGVIIG